jgi:hypothetical protein
MFKALSLKSVRPWWLRLILLLVIGIPALTGWPINMVAHRLKEMSFLTPAMGSILVLTAYACFIWIVVLLSAGTKKLLEYLAISFVLALTTSMLGAIVRNFFPIIAANMTAEEISIKMVKLFLTIITVVPYSILLINSFSAKKLIEGSARKKGKYRILALHFALAIRVFQHTGEVIYNLYEIWSEEHPEKLLPRHRRGWGMTSRSITNIFMWIWEAVAAWIFACVIHTFEPIPAMADEVERIKRAEQKRRMK